MTPEQTPPPHPLAPEWLTPRQSTEDLEAKLLPSDASRTEQGELTLGGVPVSELAATYGTPLYVVSEDDFRARARGFVTAFSQAFAPETEVDVFYAGKAFLTTHAARWATEEGLNIDTASGGELSIALAAGVEPSRIGLHGNNKSDAEITRAVELGLGRIIADSLEEISRISTIAGRLNRTANVMLRLTPGVHASTHEYIATAHEDQKFGLSVTPVPGTQTADPNPYLGSPAWSAVEQALAAPGVELIGLHCHIGSQIFEPTGFELAAQKLIGFLARVEAASGAVLPELDLGGGHGIAYTEADHPRQPEEIAQALAAAVRAACAEQGISIPRISIEPGRSIAGPAGVTLYSAGTTKDVVVQDGITRRYIAVDGGMGDNARPVLYDADYSAVLGSRKVTGEHILSRIVGKHCESGDIVVRNVYLPAAVTRGDILAVPATGAYCHSLSSNYNYLTRPAVVAVKQGQAQVLIRRETEEMMLARDTGFAPD
ncbi:diaminopimelate decarboxylase [Nesterenkonia alkaliphila]|uniref:Diaminopimelate decarboxylase n=1 Tax=Nesterenkonia alkaliphila TaxID=1463631 RepID=A0A7K1UGW8_9MICC|nr:diaminopimelate decarboxylase [Nesterenkonia alkaliphila]MVT25331.1 diaminopimelate decarboxylase [Nesterenkonia alkaliphila]GFZ94534.1 diaminopimelate decarboxylase [Nesterenkonia alkaliphila]